MNAEPECTTLCSYSDFCFQTSVWCLAAGEKTEANISKADGRVCISAQDRSFNQSQSTWAMLNVGYNHVLQNSIEGNFLLHSGEWGLILKWLNPNKRPACLRTFIWVRDLARRWELKTERHKISRDANPRRFLRIPVWHFSKVPMKGQIHGKPCLHAELLDRSWGHSLWWWCQY